MPKFQVGDLVTPVRNFPASRLHAGKIYTVTEVGLMGGANVRLEGVTSTLPHEDNLNLMQRAGATAVINTSTPVPMFQPGDLVEAREAYAGYFTLGGVYKVTKVSPHQPFDFVHVEFDDRGVSGCWTADKFNLWSTQGKIGGSPLGGPIVPGDPVPSGQPPQPWEPTQDPHYEPEPMSAEQARKERIWAALKGAAKQ